MHILVDSRALSLALVAACASPTLGCSAGADQTSSDGVDDPTSSSAEALISNCSVSARAPWKSGGYVHAEGAIACSYASNYGLDVSLEVPRNGTWVAIADLSRTYSGVYDESLSVQHLAPASGCHAYRTVTYAWRGNTEAYKIASATLCF